MTCPGAGLLPFPTLLGEFPGGVPVAPVGGAVEVMTGGGGEPGLRVVLGGKAPGGDSRGEGYDAGGGCSARR